MYRKDYTISNVPEFSSGIKKTKQNIFLAYLITKTTDDNIETIF